MVWTSESKQEWEEESPNAAILGCTEKGVFREICKNFQTNEGIQIARKKNVLRQCLDNLLVHGEDVKIRRNVVFDVST